MGDHLVKIVRGASSIQGKQVYVLMEDGRMGVHHNVKDLSRNLGNILTVGPWKASLTSSPFLHGVGATGQVLPEAALQIRGTCLCA